MPPELPHVIFASITGAGTSAVDPVLADLLPMFGYRLATGADSVHLMKDSLERYRGYPTYHSAHEPMLTYSGLLKRHDFKFIFLYRDPRDVAVSHIKLPDFKTACPNLSESELLSNYIEATMPQKFAEIVQWLNLAPERRFMLRFEDLVTDSLGTFAKAMEFLGLSLERDILDGAVSRHSYEAVTGRKRGEPGPYVRNRYAFRRGLPGDWKEVFTPEMKERVHSRFGRLLVTLGYETQESLGQPALSTEELQLLSPYDFTGDKATQPVRGPRLKWAGAREKTVIICPVWHDPLDTWRSALQSTIARLPAQPGVTIGMTLPLPFHASPPEDLLKIAATTEHQIGLLPEPEDTAALVELFAGADGYVVTNFRPAHLNCARRLGVEIIEGR